MPRDAIALAVEALSWMQSEGLSERTAVYRTSRQLGIKRRGDVRAAFRLVLETSRRMNYVDSTIVRCLRPTSLDELSLGVQNLLRLVLCSRLLGLRGSLSPESIAKTGRDLLGWKETWPVEKHLGLLLSTSVSIPDDLSEEERLALETAHPSWFVEKCLRWFGRRFAIQVLNGNLEHPPQYVRINSLRGQNARVMVELEEASLKLRPVEAVDGLFEAEQDGRGVSVTTSLPHKEGKIAVHDLSTFLAAQSLDAGPSSKVADICAAPGSKTGVVASMMDNLGLIVSIDKSRERMRLWQKEMKRLEVANAQSVLADCSGTLPLKEEFDRVLIDPPCSNSGVFAKSPYLKWRITERLVEHFRVLQSRILSSASSITAKDGVLVYCTCSVLPEENELVLERFLATRPDFRLEPLDFRIGLPGLRGFSACRRLFTHLHNCNGFFIAKLRRMRE